MSIELTRAELEVLLESIKFSKERIVNTPDTPSEVRQQNIARLEAVESKLKSVCSN